MSQLCTISKCERAVRGLCDCCKQQLCLQHLNEHNTLLIDQLNPLIDEVNALGDRVKEFCNHRTVHDSRRKLEYWRKEYHQKIDGFFDRKIQELDQLIAARIAKQQEMVLRIQSKVAKFIREQEATQRDIDLCTDRIRQLEKEMSKIEITCFRINTRFLDLDDNFVRIQETNLHEFDLSVLIHTHRTLVRPIGSYTALASSDQFLLIHQSPNLCLVDKEVNIIKQVLWTYDVIWDMCWSSAINRFIIVEENNLFLVDEKTMSIETLQTKDRRKWISCACYDTFLILSNTERGVTMVKFSLYPSVTIVKEWKSSGASARDERIEGIASNNETFAVLIRNKLEKSVRMELQSCKTLDRIWSLPLDITSNQDRRFHCCSLNLDGWLVADYESERFLHVKSTGKVKKTTSYDAVPYCMTLFNADMLVVSRSGAINFHKI